MMKKEQKIDIPITLTPEFHKEYWEHRLSSLQWGIIGFGLTITFLISGVILQMLPAYTMSEMISVACIYIAIMTAAFAFGVHMGIRTVGHMISGRIHTEHPELYEESEKKDDKNINR